MPPPFPKEVREAAWAMRCDGKMPAEITRAINAGCDELNGMAYPVKRATVISWLERFYRDRGKPESNIPVGTELDVANSELRTILTWAKTKRKEVMARGGKLDADVATMTKITNLIAGTEKAIRESRAEKSQQHQDAGRQSRKPDRGILSKIAKDEARTRAHADADQPAPTSNPAVPPPDRPDLDSAAPKAPETDDPLGTSGVGFPD